MTNEALRATVISPDGEVASILLPLDDEGLPQSLRELVGGYIQAVALPGGRYMVINENGKDGPHLVNHTATIIAHEAEAIPPRDYIAGVAIVLPGGVLR